MLAVLLLYGITPGGKALFLPVLILFAALAAIGPGFLFSALYVKYRDVGHIIPFLVQVWMYVTPVIYPTGLLPEKYRWALYINPMAGVVDGFRACFIPGKTLNAGLIASSWAVSICLFILGLYYFRKVERTFADNI